MLDVRSGTGTSDGAADIKLRAMPTDDELWRLTTEGDAQAFGVLFDRHARAVYNFCFRLSGDWSEAEDLMAAAFLEAYRRRARARVEPGKVAAWLHGVALNVARNRRRSLRRRAAALARLPRPEAQRDFGPDALGRIDAERRMRELLPVLRRLPRHELDALALCALAGLPYEDAALVLGVPVGTVRSRLSRARARVRELAGGPGHEHGDTVEQRRFAES